MNYSTGFCNSGLCIAVSLVFSGVTMNAQENLVSNPGFENSKTVAIKADAANPSPWEIIAKRGGYDIETGDQVLIPVSWGLNPSDGWGEHPDKHSYTGKFRYITGKPGEDVHSGEHAVFISANTRATVCSNAGFSVIPKIENTGKKPVLPLKEPFYFSFHAKGKGSISCYVYTYLLAGKTNYRARKVTPESFVLTDQWQKFEGTMQFADPDVANASGVVFGIEKGEATIDDVALYNVKPEASGAATGGKQEPAGAPSAK
ncbi:MAG: hypothetical protein WCS96_06620 [Victivallales bacterium]|jgi:hypothetical protein